MSLSVFTLFEIIEVLLEIFRSFNGIKQRDPNTQQ